MLNDNNSLLLIPVNSKLLHNSLHFSCLIFIERPQQTRRWGMGVKSMEWASERRCYRWSPCNTCENEWTLLVYILYIFSREPSQFSTVSLAHITHSTSSYSYLFKTLECSHSCFILCMGNFFLVPSFSPCFSPLPSS